MSNGTERPLVVSVNVGQPRTVEWQGRSVTSAIWKEVVTGSIEVRGVNVAGDDQADRRVHGGVDKAVYAYSVEDYQWWEATTGALVPGTFGENLTTRGIDLNQSCVGDHWHVGTAVLEVSQPRSPCFKLGMRMGDEAFPGRFEAAKRPGCYLRIVSEGVISAGDTIQAVPAALPAISIGSLVGDDIEPSVLALAAADGRLSESWRRSAARALARAAT
ncbi:MAG: MOSC domain-containing protein [Acidimicrobiia bacterium]|nr:MOSC domain-containing protein [Acidimicrobiia bacterium]